MLIDPRQEKCREGYTSAPDEVRPQVDQAFIKELFVDTEDHVRSELTSCRSASGDRRSPAGAAHDGSRRSRLSGVSSPKRCSAPLAVKVILLPVHGPAASVFDVDGTLVGSLDVLDGSHVRAMPGTSSGTRCSEAQGP